MGRPRCGPLGQLAHPSRASEDIAAWATSRTAAGDVLVVPEIADYEVRRELLRASLSLSVTLLDELNRTLEYLPIGTVDMRTAARLWADARQRGLPTADDRALDGDVILAAQTLGIVDAGRDAIVATTNPSHLERYVEARKWDQIG